MVSRKIEDRFFRFSINQNVNKQGSIRIPFHKKDSLFGGGTNEEGKDEIKFEIPSKLGDYGGT